MSEQTKEAVVTDVLFDERDQQYSREKITVASGADALIGTVLGKNAFSVGAPAADAGNTGDGTVTGQVAGKQTKIGTYTLTCVAAAVNGGTFSVADPDGNRLADAVVGVAYSSSQIGFTVNDGAADFVVGDIFTIDVTDGDGKYKALDLTDTSGLQKAFGVLITKAEAASADAVGVAIVRDAIVKLGGLAWPAGITANQKTAALSELAALGIITREVA